MTTEGGAASAAGGGPTLGTIGQDRPCARCGFNLHGQMIVREQHYGMVMVRCPECGEAAALQEYPTLGRWAGRIGVALGLAWLAFVLACIVVTGTVLMGLSQGTATDILHPASIRIVESYRAFALEKSAEIEDENVRQQTVAWLSTYTVEQWPWVGSEYVGTPEYAAMIGSIDPGSRADWRRARTGLWMVLWSVLMGMAWSVMVCHLRRRGLAVLALAIALVGMCRWGLHVLSGGGYGIGWSSGWGWGSGYEWGPDLAQRNFGGWLVVSGIALGAVFLYLGMLVGRPIARLLVVLLVPPRLRAPLGMLWTLHGLTPPGVGRGWAGGRYTCAGRERRRDGTVEAARDGSGGPLPGG